MAGTFVKIKFKEDCRNFKKDEEIVFDFKDVDTRVMVGANGSGKSTLVNILRLFKCDNKSSGSKSLNEHDNKVLLGNVADVETDFKKIFVFSSEYDDPLSMNNSYDACMFIDFGGFYTAHKSKGERFKTMFAKFIYENRDSFDEDSLIIFDEPDAGFDLQCQNNNTSVYSGIPSKHKSKVLVISHSVIAILRSNTVYDISKRKYIDSEDYIREATGWPIKIDYDALVTDGLKEKETTEK